MIDVTDDGSRAIRRRRRRRTVIGWLAGLAVVCALAAAAAMLFVLNSWYVGAKYGQTPVMWIPIALAGVLGVAAGVGTIVMINNIVIGATVTAGVIALIYFITHSQQ